MSTQSPLVSPFNNGFWVWDDLKNILHFVSRDTGLKTVSTIKDATKATMIEGTTTTDFEITFRDISDKLEKLIFRRYFQRKVKPSEPDVITVQDIKDIALYLANVTDLTVDFIHFIHTSTLDRFFRAAIIYFQYFLDLNEWMMERRHEEAKKLRQPVVITLENVKRDDLADLRAMFAKAYLSVICGLGDAKKFHHMSNEGFQSLSEKDRILFEKLMCLTVRMVWIALQRKNLHVIEMELNRMFRTDSFNVILHRPDGYTIQRTAAEERVLRGEGNRFERMLLQRSPLLKELLFAEHDYRMLGVGVKSFEPTDARLDYMEAAFTAPEESIIAMGVGIGLLGVPREEFDPVLVQRERTSKTFLKETTEIPEFKLPPKERKSCTETPNIFPSEPARFKETKMTRASRKMQCKMWAIHVHSALSGAESTHEQVPNDSLISGLNRG